MAHSLSSSSSTPTNPATDIDFVETHFKDRVADTLKGWEALLDEEAQANSDFTPEMAETVKTHLSQVYVPSLLTLSETLTALQMQLVKYGLLAMTFVELPKQQGSPSEEPAPSEPDTALSSDITSPAVSSHETRDTKTIIFETLQRHFSHFLFIKPMLDRLHDDFGKFAQAQLTETNTMHSALTKMRKRTRERLIKAGNVGLGMELLQQIPEAPFIASAFFTRLSHDLADLKDVESYRSALESIFFSIEVTLHTLERDLSYYFLENGCLTLHHYSGSSAKIYSLTQISSWLGERTSKIAGKIAEVLTHYPFDERSALPALLESAKIGDDEKKMISAHSAAVKPESQLETSAVSASVMDLHDYTIACLDALTSFKPLLIPQIDPEYDQFPDDIHVEYLDWLCEAFSKLIGKLNSVASETDNLNKISNSRTAVAISVLVKSSYLICREIVGINDINAQGVQTDFGSFVSELESSWSQLEKIVDSRLVRGKIEFNAMAYSIFFADRPIEELPKLLKLASKLPSLERRRSLAKNYKDIMAKHFQALREEREKTQTAAAAASSQPRQAPQQLFYLNPVGGDSHSYHQQQMMGSPNDPAETNRDDGHAATRRSPQ